MPMRIYRIAGTVLLAGWLVFGLTAPAGAQDASALLDRIERLERDIRTLNISLARSESTTPADLASGSAETMAQPANRLSNAAVARIDARIAALENDVRVATGAMEEIDHRIFQISSQLEKLMSDVSFRLSALEQQAANSSFANAGDNAMSPTGELQINTAPPVGSVTSVLTQSSSGVLGTITENQLQIIGDQAASIPNQKQKEQTSVATQQTQESMAVPVVPQVQTQPAAEIASATQETGASAQEDYTYAFGLLRQAKYDDAATALQKFVEVHGDDPLAANAQYWLGETFYVRSQFVKAAEVFFEGYRANPHGIKAPDTLLKLGMSLSNLGKKPEACAAFAKLASEFEDISSSVRATMDRERIRNEC